MMVCQLCVYDCEAKSDCWGGDDEFICPCERCGCEYVSTPAECTCSSPCYRFTDQDEHNTAQHAMNLEGTTFRCVKGHEIEQSPAEMMRAAGIKEML